MFDFLESGNLFEILMDLKETFGAGGRRGAELAFEEISRFLKGEEYPDYRTLYVMSKMGKGRVRVYFEETVWESAGEGPITAEFGACNLKHYVPIELEENPGNEKFTIILPTPDAEIHMSEFSEKFQLTPCQLSDVPVTGEGTPVKEEETEVENERLEGDERSAETESGNVVADQVPSTEGEESSKRKAESELESEPKKIKSEPADDAEKVRPKIIPVASYDKTSINLISSDEETETCEEVSAITEPVAPKTSSEWAEQHKTRMLTRIREEIGEKLGKEGNDWVCTDDDREKLKADTNLAELAVECGLLSRPTDQAVAGTSGEGKKAEDLSSVSDMEMGDESDTDDDEVSELRRKVVRLLAHKNRQDENVRSLESKLKESESVCDNLLTMATKRKVTLDKSQSELEFLRKEVKDLERQNAEAHTKFGEAKAKIEELAIMFGVDITQAVTEPSIDSRPPTPDNSPPAHGTRTKKGKKTPVKVKKTPDSGDTSDLGMFPCETCDKKFLSKTAFRRHSPRCSAKKDIKCPEEGCGRCFKVNQDLKDHVGIHTDKFKCPRCQKRFGCKRFLEKHEKSCPGGPQEK
jgi:uncharacterized coiled-coil protein SlyX